jgi:hypothetical protein
MSQTTDETPAQARRRRSRELIDAVDAAEARARDARLAHMAARDALAEAHAAYEAALIAGRAGPPVPPDHGPSLPSAEAPGGGGVARATAQRTEPLAPRVNRPPAPPAPAGEAILAAKAGASGGPVEVDSLGVPRESKFQKPCAKCGRWIRWSHAECPACRDPRRAVSAAPPSPTEAAPDAPRAFDAPAEWSALCGRLDEAAGKLVPEGDRRRAYGAMAARALACRTRQEFGAVRHDLCAALDALAPAGAVAEPKPKRRRKAKPPAKACCRICAARLPPGGMALSGEGLTCPRCESAGPAIAVVCSTSAYAVRLQCFERADGSVVCRAGEGQLGNWSAPELPAAGRVPSGAALAGVVSDRLRRPLALDAAADAEGGTLVLEFVPAGRTGAAPAAGELFPAEAVEAGPYAEGK